MPTLADLGRDTTTPPRATDREAWLAAAWLRITTADGLRNDIAAQVIPLPSFPRTRTRAGTILGELAPIQSSSAGRWRAALVSPALSESVEVVTVLDYLHARWRAAYWNAYNPTRPTAAERHRLAHYGYEAPFSRIVPTTAALDRIQATTAHIVSLLGDYPHEPVAVAPYRPQGTRMLKAMCSGTEHDPHADYIVRISQAQADRGMPLCPICYGFHGGLIRTLSLAS